jgi:uncharacterized membrane protein YhaH (DUF805 family)
MSIARDDFDYRDNVYASPTRAWDSLAPAGPNQSILWLLFSFNGRITRSQYWSGIIPTAMAYFGMLVLLEAFGDKMNEFARAGAAITCMVTCVCAMLAIQVKRWHDRGKSGLWVFIKIVPIIGPLWTFIELGCLPGDAFDNDYGPSERGQLFQREESARR